VLSSEILPPFHPKICLKPQVPLLKVPGKNITSIKLLTPLTQQIDLKEIIGQHDKNDLIDDHREGPRGEIGQVAKALELTIPLFGRGAQMVLLLSLAWVLDFLGVN